MRRPWLGAWRAPYFGDGRVLGCLHPGQQFFLDRWSRGEYEELIARVGDWNSGWVKTRLEGVVSF